MRRTVLTLAALTTLFFVVSQPNATAQETLFGVGPKAGIYLKGHLMLGGVVEIPFSRNFYAEPGIEVIFPGDNRMRIALDANGRYAFRPRGESFAPYLLGGLGIVTVISSNEGTATKTDPFLNLGGGLFLNTRDPMQYFLGLKAVIGSGDSDVLLQGGIVWYL